MGNKKRELVACDGTHIRTAAGDEPLSPAAILNMFGSGHHTRMYCSHGWDDIEHIALYFMRRFPEAPTPMHDGWRGTFNMRRHFYSFAVRYNGVTVDFCDILNITRDNDISVSRETFGGETDIDTTWNIVREIADRRLEGTTISGMALHDYIGGDMRRFRQRFPQLAHDDYERMRPAYFGAYLQANDGEYAECSSWDVNSLYPSTLLRPMPCGEPEWYDGPYEQDDDMPLHVDIVTFRADLKPGGLPMLTNLLPVWGWEHRTTSTYGYVTMPLCDVDMRLVRENYDTSVYEVRGGWKFHANQGYFESYVSEWFRVKQHASGVRRQMAKLMLNAMVGKMGAAIDRPMLRPEPDDDGGIRYVMDKSRHASLSYLPVAIWVNAYGRETLTHAIHANRSRVIYADTDSMICAGMEPPETIIVGDGLGEWKNDHNYIKLRILGPRKYAGVETDGTQSMRLSGVHRADPIPYDEFLPGSTHFNDWGGKFVL